MDGLPVWRRWKYNQVSLLLGMSWAKMATALIRYIPIIFFTVFVLVHHSMTTATECFDITGILVSFCAPVQSFSDASTTNDDCPMGLSAVGGCKNGSVDTLEVMPKSVQHCREQFRYFPCCNLKDKEIRQERYHNQHLFR